TAVAAIILGCILGLPSAAASSAPSEIGPASASDGCAPIIASVSPSGVIIRDGNNQRFDAKVLCGGASDITNDPATKIGWSVAGGIGNVNPRNGNGTTFNANNEGSGQVVAYVQYYELTAEARADVEVVGSGGSCQTLTVSTIPPGALVPVGQGKSFRALVRCDGNNISSSSQVGWSVVGGIGTVNPGTGQVTNFTGTAAGPGRVNAGVHYGNQNLGGHAVVVVSGSGGNNAPYVTGTVPTDGATDVLRNTTIDISFSAAMNASATEGAISSSPAITGSFSWPSTSRVVWTPGWLLTASTKYAVTVSTAAKSQAGQNLARLHLFNFTTGQNGLGAPMILSTDPADGTMNVPVNSTIIFEWSLDMQRATAEGATSSGPAISGSWTWNAGDTRATWTPGTLLQASTQYTVNVTTAATSQNGTKMAGPYSFKFTTAGPPPPPAPAVTSTDPTNNQQGVAVGAKVEVTFNLPMEIAPTEGAVSASPAIAGTFGWVLNDTKFVLTPSSPLQAGTAYTVTISSSAKSKAGATLPSPYSFKFSTAESQQVPQVVSNSPANGQQNVPVSVDIVVTFSIAMDKASVVNALSFSPAAPGTLAWSAGDTVLTVNPSADLQAAVQYTVRIDTVAKSAQGVALPSEHVFVFTTAAGDLAIPKITGTIPWDGAVGVFRNTSIVIAFDLPMEPVATEGAISASPAITGTITWGPLDLELTL
ncbi:MAG TPA: Ig-like domain-containing protein, partial [Thermoplasmata archaeon]|nr:Ig-like domain-containing protein [Thermoplasmata archaeon]